MVEGFERGSPDFRRSRYFVVPNQLGSLRVRRCELEGRGWFEESVRDSSDFRLRSPSCCLESVQVVAWEPLSSFQVRGKPRYPAGPHASSN